MSKSYGNTIDIFGEEKETRKRIMSIVTDSTAVDAPKDPTNSTIVQLYSHFASAEETDAMRESFRKGGTGYGEYKKILHHGFHAAFDAARVRHAELSRDPERIDRTLAEGAERARGIAAPIISRVREAVGL